jgi:hypothetical protein
MTDYRTLSGAEFQRMVGTDPDKWADAAIEDAHQRGFTVKRDWLRAVLADAMDAAACRGSIREVIEGDKT